MYASNNVEFMGVLVDRKYTSSQRCVQLVFDTAEGIRLSLSRNVDLVRSLKLGLTYRINGPEHVVGQKRYIHEPTATLVPVTESPSFFRRYKILIPAAIGLVVVLGGAGAWAYISADSQATVQHEETTAPVTKSKSRTTTTDTGRPTTNTQATADTAAPTSPKQQTAATTTPSKKKSVSPPATTVTTAKPVVNNVATPVTQDSSNLPISQEDSTTQVTEQTLNDSQTTSDPVPISQE